VRAAPFRGPAGRVDPILVALFVAVNGLVLANALLHDPTIGYDAPAHLRYVKALSSGRLPTERDTYEFFTPPLSYLAPAAAVAAGLAMPAAAKLAQVLNVAWSLGLCVFLLTAAEAIRPGRLPFRRASLLLLGMLPVYYKTFAFVRPEPLLGFLSVAAVATALRLFGDAVRRARDALGLGVVLGLLVLARQQGFFVILAVALYAAGRAWSDGSARARILRDGAIALVVALAVGGWFYVGLKLRYGSVLAYAKAPARFSFASQPLDFYLGLGGRVLFRDPVRPAFRNQLLPILYSETWGDYEGYFLLVGRDARDGSVLSGADFDARVPAKRHKYWLQTNRFEMGRYLGRVNLLALFPTALFVAGVIAAVPALLGRARDDGDAGLALPLLVVAVSFGSFLLLLTVYPSLSGNMIKATYLLPAFPMLALLAGAWLDRASLRWPRTHALLVAGLLLVALHDGGAYLTAYRSGNLARPEPADEREGGGPSTEAVDPLQLAEPPHVAVGVCRGIRGEEHLPHGRAMSTTPAGSAGMSSDLNA
jgi:hypothetical protein